MIQTDPMYPLSTFPQCNILQNDSIITQDVVSDTVKDSEQFYHHKDALFCPFIATATSLPLPSPP